MEWISVEDRLPKDDGEYLVHLDSGDIFVDEYNTDWLFGSDNYNESMQAALGVPEICVTHWMPLPEPPQDDKE